MRSLRLLASMVAFVGISSGARAQAALPPSAEANTPKANISIGQGQIDADAVERLLAKVEAIKNGTDAQTEITIDEILSFLPLTADERANVSAAHPGVVPISCSGDICTGVSRGQELYQTLSQINNIPAYFARTVTLKVRWRGPSVLEICNVKGFQVKQLFWVDVDGAYIDARGAEGSSFVDVSIGGSYPNC